MEIILKAVSKKIGYTQVLDNINCLFLDGKIYGIVGYNGSGKTMLLRTIAGLVIPTSSCLPPSRFVTTTNTTTRGESLLQTTGKNQVICISISGFGDSMICSRYLESTTTSDSFLPLKKARMCSFEI